MEELGNGYGGNGNGDGNGSPPGKPLFAIKNLGEPRFRNKIELPEDRFFVGGNQHIPYNIFATGEDSDVKSPSPDQSFEKAGPREKVYFESEKTSCAVVTCGGLCPGMNAVIRALVMQLWYRYGCRRILGVPFGYMGFDPNHKETLRPLKPADLGNTHEVGGSVLGSSRGTPPTSVIVDRLVSEKIDILFTIGGDGTMAGAHAIVEEIERRGLKIAVIGIPKTIDNDIPFVKRSFGFETAVSHAANAIKAAHIEALSYERSVGLVKVMGRHSGYIAAHATLATGDANFCLIPESPFALEGKNGLYKLLEDRIAKRNHALIVVAEGSGQEFFADDSAGQDASGNVKLRDIGVYLKQAIRGHFADAGSPVTVKYIDPSYIIRAASPNPADHLICSKFAQNAVHAGMTGRTGMLVGYWHGCLTHVPFEALVGRRQSISLKGDLWFSVLESTGQPIKIE